MEEKKSKKHHCIPQFYLNYFGIEQKKEVFQIHVYNKNSGNKFRQVVSNIAYVKDYNTIEIDGTKNVKFEELHNEIYERTMAKFYKFIITKIEKNIIDRKYFNCLSIERILAMEDECITQEEKEFLSMMLAYFMIRNKRIRYATEEMVERMKLIYEDIYKAYKLDLSKLEENIMNDFGDEKIRKLIYIKLPFDYEMITTFTDWICTHTCNIGYNDTNQLLYTNDNAYGLDCMVYTPRSRGIGINSYGNVIMFPLTPKICLIMYDSKFIRNTPNLVIDKKLVFLNSKIIRNINENIIYGGIDEIYSQDGDWSTLDELKNNGNLPLKHKPYKVY